uniref:Putative tick transposon n=1 Tax=Rhipicephalus pulchellus TaxID=72859 RepID=L7M0D4_RHIPC
MYRLFAGVIKAWMSGWAETKGLLTELQNGFRPGRRLDDNLFVVTQCAEVARKEGRTLLCCFLDVEKAYDNVPHGPLFACLSDLGLPQLLISTIRRMYSDNVVSVQLGSIITGPIRVKKGLRQGCPLSPLLYILYASRVERALLNSNLGFSMRFSTTSASENHRLPGLAFADDLVVMAESNQELQSLLDICQKEIASLGLRFNTKKSAVVCLAGRSTDAAALTLAGEPLAARNDYRYLGVTLCVGAARYSQHETMIRQAALQGQRILRRRCLWGCNRFQMIRDLWKMVHVPGLTFGNAVVCLSPTTREWLERQQREVGRAALGCHGRVANEAVQGDVGWSSFEAREAASKIIYRGRLMRMRRARWARRVFEYLSATCMRTDWTRRIYQLEKKYGFFAEAISTETASKWAVEVRLRVREAEDTQWRKAMEAKSTLECYRKHKESISGSRFYDNSAGSSLLFEARAGALRTLEYRRRFDNTFVSSLCRVCGVETETQEHLVLRCRSLPTAPVEGATLPQALGFQLLDEDGSSDNGMGRYAVAVTKRRLAEWWATVRRT